MKKSLYLILVSLICLILVGCGSSISNEKELNNKEENITENENNDNNLNIISTNNKLVFTDISGYYMVFNYDGESLINVQWIMPLESKAQATAMAELYKKEQYENLYEVNVDGKNVILTYTEDYMDTSYGAISKTQMETYLTTAGYTIKK